MHPDWWDIKRSEANAPEVKRCEHVRHTNSNDTRKRGWTLPHCSMHPMCSRTCELVESVAPYPKTSTEELNQCGCHKRCPRGVPEAKQSCLHDLFGFFYRCRCHEHVSLLNLLHRIPEELSQSGCHKRCPRGVPEASEGGVEPTGGGRGGGGGGSGGGAPYI